MFSFDGSCCGGAGGCGVWDGDEDVVGGCCFGGGNSVSGLVLARGFVRWENGAGWLGEVAVA